MILLLSFQLHKPSTIPFISPSHNMTKFLRHACFGIFPPCETQPSSPLPSLLLLRSMCRIQFPFFTSSILFSHFHLGAATKQLRSVSEISDLMYFPQQLMLLLSASVSYPAFLMIVLKSDGYPSSSR